MRGIGVPGMPAGIAGMGGAKPEATDVITLDSHSRVFARV